jgi:type IV secretory pathway TrbF-like protein
VPPRSRTRLRGCGHGRIAQELSSRQALTDRRQPTVGYGDIYPHTTSGRIIAIGVMLLGIGFLAVLTATIASRFVQVDQQSETSEVLQTLHRIEADVAELKTQLAARQ